MRLIDADKLPIYSTIEGIEKSEKGTVAIIGNWVSAIFIEEAPTVKAIPVEWLEQMWERDKDGFVDEYGVYHSSDDSLGESCRHVLENWNTNYKWKWEKENGISQ